MKFSTTVLVMLLALSGCVDRYDVPTANTTPRVVVEGGFSNLPPPYNVTLTTAANYSSNLDGITRYISGATVEIQSYEGESIPFFEVSKGRYSSASNCPAGVIGHTYFLIITLPNDKVIFSRPQKLPEPLPIAKAFSEFNTDGRPGFQVFVQANDPAGVRNFYKWETLAYYPYSRYCFNRVSDKTISYILSDEGIDGNTVGPQPISKIPFDNTTLCLIEIYQYTLPEQTYTFLHQVVQQLNTSGSIFDPPPTYLKGNLYYPNDERETALGYFQVLSGTKSTLLVDRSRTGQIPRPLNPLKTDPLYCGDPCDEVCVSRGGGTCGLRPCPPDCASIPGNTNIAPDGWPLEHKPCD